MIWFLSLVLIISLIAPDFIGNAIGFIITLGVLLILAAPVIWFCGLLFRM